MDNQKLNVFIQLGKGHQQVGQLILDGKDILFRYHPEYLQSGHNISPFKLQFNDTIQTASKTPFEGLFGVFADSLPDAWGRLLLKRYFNSQGLPADKITMLDRLAFVGDDGLGALTYKPEKIDTPTGGKLIDLDYMDHQVQHIIKGESSDIIDTLFEKGGSPGGARPKVYTHYHPKNDTLSFARKDFERDEEEWIIKFAADVDASDIANIEFAYYLMALDAGIEMNKSRLFKGKSGKSYFGTKRFDRKDHEKMHMISAAGLFHDDYQNSQLDYGILLNEGYNLTKNAKTQKDIIRLSAFNLYSHNRDDHSKNFAFLMDESGQWSFAPAYDLTFSSSSHGHHSTSYAGNSFDPGSKELLELANHFSIRDGKIIIEAVKESTSKWHKFADEAGVSKSSKRTIQNSIERLLKT